MNQDEIIDHLNKEMEILKLMLDDANKIEIMLTRLIELSQSDLNAKKKLQYISNVLSTSEVNNLFVNVRHALLELNTKKNNSQYKRKYIKSIV